MSSRRRPVEPQQVGRDERVADAGLELGEHAGRLHLGHGLVVAGAHVRVVLAAADALRDQDATAARRGPRGA